MLTLAAAGSEMSNSDVITNDTITPWVKQGITSETVRPLVAFMNPENTFTVSKFQTGCGIVDIMMHTMERYFLGVGDCDLTERLAEGLLIACVMLAELLLQIQKIMRLELLDVGIFTKP